LSTRRDSSFLNDILVATGKIGAIVAATSEKSFFADEIRQAAVLHHLTVIGEAMNRLSPAIREMHPEVPWQQIVSVRKPHRARVLRPGLANPLGGRDRRGSRVATTNRDDTQRRVPGISSNCARAADAGR
jgi:hypothetical protein